MLNPMSAAYRAKRAWMRINDKPTEITIARDADDLEAQTVRVELSSSANDVNGEHAAPGVQKCVVFGIKDHATLPDTDIQVGDRFEVDDVEYVVISIINTIGEIQAIGEATG
jgi:hypothetical protein